MKLNKCVVRIAPLSEVAQKLADKHNQTSSDFKFCGEPELYFEGTLPVSLVSELKYNDEFALKIGKMFLDEVESAKILNS